MNEFPTSWSIVSISAVLEPNENGKAFQQGWSPQCGKTPAAEREWGVLKTTAIQDGEFLPEENKSLPKSLKPRPHLEVKVGDILMTCAGPRNRCGIACLVHTTRLKLMISGKMYRFRPDRQKIMPKYLEAYLHTRDAKLAIDRMKTGISDSGLNLTHSRFAELLIPLPPLKEQGRIMNKIEEMLSELDKGIEYLKDANEQLKAFYQSVLDKSFCELSQTRPLRNLLSQPLSNGYSGKPVKHTSEYKVLSLSSTTSGTFDDKHYKFLDEEGLDDRDIWCEPNDILIQRGNTLEYVGVPAIYTGQRKSFIFPDLMIRLKADEKVITPKYLYYVLCSPKIRNYLRSRAKGSAGTMPKINQATLASTPVPYCPKDAQQKIIQQIEMKLSNHSILAESIEQSVRKLEGLRSSILAMAFAGRLVAQDPKDEPASVLLDRIKAEKDRQNKGNKNNKRRDAA